MRWREWKNEAALVLESHEEYYDAKQEIQKAYDDLKEAYKAMQKAQETAYRTLNEVEPPQPLVPEPQITAVAPDPIFTTADDYESASVKLIRRKKLIGKLGDE
jgi:hypothetical protein